MLYWDVDNVVRNVLVGLQNVCKQLTWCDLKELSWETYGNPTIQNLLSFPYVKDVLLNSPPTKYYSVAKDFLENNGEIYFITRALPEYTTTWIHTYFGEKGVHIVYVSKSIQKMYILNKEEDILIDDYPYFDADFYSNVFLIDYPYNKNVKHPLVRIKTVDDLRQSIFQYFK